VASHQRPRNFFRRPENQETRRRQAPPPRPPSPHPRIAPPPVRHQAPLPPLPREPRPLPIRNRDIPVIPREPSSPPNSSTSEEDKKYVLSQKAQHCFLPDELFLHITLPTRSPTELTVFKFNCQLRYDQILAQHTDPVNLPDTAVTIPLARLYQLTPDPIVFLNLLWKSRTKFDHFGITEEYFWIRRNYRIPHLVYLARAYRIYYPWSDDTWTVSRLRHAHP
jgi:hypothetical protein